jgi:RNA polymerase sigma-70 factor (ECF subfamily)
VDLSDEELVKLSQRGDLKSFTILVERYQKKIFRLAYSLVHDTDEAKDLTQESFIRAYTSVESFRGTARFYTWIYRITVNLCRDHFRKRTLEKAVGNPENDPYLNPSTPDTVASQHEIDRIVRQAISELPDDQRTVVILREIEELSYQEIANVTGISLGTVMSRLFYARQKLRKLLKPYLHGEDHE